MDVQLPDGTLVKNVPDGMTQTQLMAKLGRPAPAEPPSTAATAGNAVAKGAAGFGDMIGNGLVNTANLGIAGYGAVKGALGGKGSELPDLIPRDALSGYEKMARAGGLIQDKSEPVDTKGRVVDMVGQVVGGGGINPAAIVRSASRGAILPIARDLAAATAGGIGAATGQELTRNVDTGSEALDRAIKLAATLGGGAAPSAALAARGTAGDRAAAATAGVTPKQWADAIKTQEKANTAGSQLTGYESLQGVTGTNPKMQTQQRLAEQSDHGAPLVNIAQNRNQNNASYADKVINEIAPAEQFPDTLAGTLRQAAENSIADAQKKRTEAVRPNYQEQRNSDIGAIRLTDAVPSLEAKLADRLASRGDARQQTGQIIGRENEMRIGAENATPVPGQPRFPPRYTLQNDRAIEAGKAIPDFEAVAKTRSAQVSEAERTLGVAQDALASKNLPYIQGKVSGFLKSLDENIRLAGPTREGKVLKEFRDEIAPEGAPVFLPSQLESIYKANRDKLDTNIMSSAEDKTRAAVLGGHVKNLDSLIQEVSPAIREGRAKYAQISKEVVDPLKVSQVGKLTRSDDFRQQASTLLPENPLDVTPAVIDRTIKTISAQDPDITRKLLAQYLRGTFNESNGGGVSSNAMGGYQFAKKVADNPGQQANLVQAIESSGAKSAPLLDALEVFRAQGQRPGVNSATQSNLDEASALGGKKFADALLHPVKVAPGYISGKVDSYRNGAAAKELAKVLSDPNSVQRIQELARSNGTYNPLTQQMLAQMLLASHQNSATQKQEQP